MLRRLLISATVLLALVATTAVAIAQTGQARPPGASQQAPNPLGLTPSQTAQMTAIGMASAAKVQAILTDFAESRATRASQMQAVVNEMVQKQRAFLDPKKRALYDQMRASAVTHDFLHRTMYQKIQSKVIQTETQLKIQALVANKSMPEAKRTAEANALMEQNRQDQLAILTPDQRKMVSEIQAQMLREQMSQQASHGAAPNGTAHP